MMCYVKTVQLIDKRGLFNKQTHIFFIDYVKAFDEVNWQTLWVILKMKGISRCLIQVIKSLYKDMKIPLDLGNKLN